jgi:hypothetical protein
VYIEACSVPCPAGASADAWRRTCRDVDTLARRLADEFLSLTMSLAQK